jgi:hypothetical protein
VRAGGVAIEESGGDPVDGADGAAVDAHLPDVAEPGNPHAKARCRDVPRPSPPDDHEGW